MARFVIQDEAQALRIIEAYKACGNCADCYLNTPAGWRCSYMHEVAQKYLKAKHGKGQDN